MAGENGAFDLMYMRGEYRRSVSVQLRTEKDSMKKFLLAVASLVVMWANSAGATIIVVNPPARVPEFNGTVFDWTYAAVLQTKDMKPGDFFTIYDFPFAALLSTPSFGTTSGDDKASFLVTVNNLGQNPDN